MASAATPGPRRVAEAFREIQDALSAEVEAREPGSSREDHWERPGGGGGCSRAVEGRTVLEKGGVNFSRIRGDSLPETASDRHPEFAGKPFEATGVSVVFHPVNPYAPSGHFNVRAFFVEPDAAGTEPGWWFGGGFDLTPCYGFDEDAAEWHRAAEKACSELEPGLYRRLKRQCDDYFHLPHRGERRGIGGIFFDDFRGPGFEETFRFCRSVAETFRGTYFRILDRRRNHPFDERERDHQLVRRGRYVEFNLLYDRGTRFGLASGGRTESILMSLPARAAWRYDHRPPPGSPEALLAERYLRPRDWLAEGFPPEPGGSG